MVSTVKGQVFVLYGLELDTFCNVTHADCPTYDLITDFIKFLNCLNIHCYHDAFESLAFASQDFAHRIEKAIQNSKVVIVVCSEVLHTAFNEATRDVLVQMKFCKMSPQSVRKLMLKSPEKFIPVTLAGQSLLPCRELQHQRCYGLQNFERFMDAVGDDLCDGRITELLKTEKRFSELQNFVKHLQELLSQTG